MIVSLSDPGSVPSNFQEVLTEYTQQGYRVLALAHRPLAKLSYVKAQRVQRETLEANLTFLGKTLPSLFKRVALTVSFRDHHYLPSYSTDLSITE